MVQDNRNWSSQYPVTYFMGGTGTEHLAVQMDGNIQDKENSLQPIFHPSNLSAVDPYAWPKRVINCDFNGERVHIYPAVLWRVILLQAECVLCDSSIEKCQTPQALDVSSRPPHLHDHVSLRVGEKAVSQWKGRRKKRFYIPCFGQLRVQHTVVHKCITSGFIAVIGTWFMA